MARVFAEAGLIDPKGWIGVFAVGAFRPADRSSPPRRPSGAALLEGLLDPAYRGQVVFGGWRREGVQRYGQFNKFFLLSMARAFGPSGLTRLLANVPGLLHSAQMPGWRERILLPAVSYVLPWSLADICPRRAETQVICRRMARLAYPLWLTAKTADRRRLDPLIRHFHGAELADYLNDNRYPPLCPEVSPTLPRDATFQWLGWDYLRHPSTAKDIQTACRLFDARQAAFAPAESPPCG